MAITRILAAAFASLLLAPPAGAAFTTCRLTYSLSGWSVFYKHYDGSGRVRCENGESTDVRIVARGGGITFGKSQIDDGKGTFSEVRDISEVFGTYVSADAHAGATSAVEAWSMTKGSVSLALTGKGRGVDLGFAFGSFRIERR